MEADVGKGDSSKKGMADKGESLFHYSSTILVAINGTKRSKLALKWALDAFLSVERVHLKLFYVRPPVKTIPTPMGAFVPISQVRDDIVSAYKKDIECQTRAMIFPYKEICSRRKLEVEIVVREGDDVAKEIGKEVENFNISRLVIGASSRNMITRKLKGIKMSNKISESTPNFCTVFVIRKGKLLAVRTRTDERSNNERICISSSCNSESVDADALQKSLNPPNMHVQIPRVEILSTEDNKSDDTGSPCSILHSSISSNSEDDISTVSSSTYELQSSKSKMSNYRYHGANFNSSELGWSAMSNDLSESLLPGHKLNELSHDEERASLKENNSIKMEAKNFDLFAKKCIKEASMVKTTRKPEDKQTLERSISSNNKKYNNYTWEEIESATSSFSDALKLGTGANGTVYKCNFHHEIAAVKILNLNEECGTKQFKQEVEILTRISHPHILTLLGACPTRGCLVYEYMKNGSLDDRLKCKYNTPPLPWYHRLRIAWEVASALVFLHHSQLVPIIHRDLKPANILLDENFVSKIGDVGLSTLLPSANSIITAPVGTFFYIDPEYQRTGLVSPKSDIYALGVVILQLLTAKPPMGLAHTVEMVMEDGELMEILDPKAGQWLKGLAEELVLLGLSCLELRPEDRPDLKDQVLPVLRRLKEMADEVSYLGFEICVPGSKY
ncbi:U-box domain-containing protein 52-like [Phalaenopsis equestris]|uniref:U-box domain-containing protein 52-like n=1 Tax=Phalaenopsis equestris TaxID=78828 RepID=UPI0009E3AECD|nr:U-box domain-containing protein 52-like [Phalaenopsis equestris]